MKHGILFFSLLVSLAGVAGGLFVLVSEEGNTAEIPEEALVAGVEQVAEPESQKDEMFEARLQTEQKVPKQALVPKPTPAPTSSQAAPAPTPIATLAPQPSQIQPKPPAPAPSPPPAGGPTQTPTPPPPPPAGKININTASLEELDQITGVGPAIAQRIVDYRNQNGPFQTIEEIKNVSGIGDVNFERMKDEITVGDVAPEPSPPPPAPTPTPAPESEKININTASYEELQQITGVGEVIAQRIIDYRNQNGLFQKIEDIKNVKGIGDATFEKMKDEITV